MIDIIATAQNDTTILMNVIDSLRELLVLTVAGIVVYKLDHKDLIKKGTSKIGEACRIAKRAEDVEQKLVHHDEPLLDENRAPITNPDQLVTVPAKQVKGVRTVSTVDGDFSVNY